MCVLGNFFPDYDRGDGAGYHKLIVADIKYISAIISSFY